MQDYWTMKFWKEAQRPPNKLERQHKILKLTIFVSSNAPNPKFKKSL